MWEAEEFVGLESKERISSEEKCDQAGVPELLGRERMYVCV